MSQEQVIPEVILDTDVLLAAAKEETGLSDFGDSSFRKPFELLVKALNDEANLNAVGRFTQYQRILNSLKNRLRMEEYIRLHPAILDEQIDAPVVIVGLPRTGTTMLHRILASDSRFYAPLWYEVRNPSPYLDWDLNSKDQRIIEAEAEIDIMLEANPELASIHPMDPTGADEEILLLEHSFYSYVPDAFANVPSYGEWVGSNDNTPAYEYLKRQLQFLQWQKKQRGQQAERWLLKAPHHLHFMGILLKVFPDATVVQSHRDPVVTIPSIASFHANLWILASDEVDKKAAADEWSALFAKGTLHTMEVRQQLSDHFFDVWFKDTVAKPMEVIETLYKRIGLPLTDEAQEAMKQWREDNRREDRPPHEYTLEEYGFTEAGLKAQFKAYREAFIEGKE